MIEAAIRVSIWLSVTCFLELSIVSVREERPRVTTAVCILIYSNQIQHLLWNKCFPCSFEHQTCILGGEKGLKLLNNCWSQQVGHVCRRTVSAADLPIAWAQLVPAGGTGRTRAGLSLALGRWGSGCCKEGARVATPQGSKGQEEAPKGQYWMWLATRVTKPLRELCAYPACCQQNSCQHLFVADEVY